MPQRSGASPIRSSGTDLRRPFWMAAFILALLFTAGTARGQVLYGSLTGTVTDSTGAVVAGAKVSAQNVQTGVVASATTDPDGIYRISNLQAGTYKVTIAAQGFANQQTAGVQVNVNEVARVDAQLKVGPATQQVVVTTQAPILQTDKADVHTDISSQQIENLPVMGSQGRNFQSLLKTVPGAGLTAETNSLAGNPQRAINTNINGQSNQSVNTRVDGVQDAYPWLPANVAYVPPADAIESVNVVTNSFDAEQGNAGGAAVNVQIKSGTDQLHGGVHEFYTSQNLQAKQYFLTSQKKNVYIQHQYGADLGGKIVRDKLFFFGDYERTTVRQAAGPDVRTLPTAAMAAGDFRGLPGNPVIYDPATGDATGAGKSPISCNGEVNVICPDRIDPASAAMVKLLQPKIAQETKTSDDTNNFFGSGTAYFNRDDADIKINYVPTQTTTVFGRYSFSKSLVFDPPLLGAAVGDATNGGQLGQAPGLVQNIGIGATHAFTTQLLLDWNFGFTRQRLGSTYDLSTAKGLNDLKIPGTNNAGAAGDPTLYYGLPGFVFPTGTPAPGTTATGIAIAALGNAQPANPFLFRDEQFVTNANLSWNKGQHAFRGGIEWNHSMLNHFQPQGGTFQEPRGSFEFNGFVTSNKGGPSPTWFNSWADFLLGLPSGTGKARALFNPTALRWSQWAGYVQDRWQLNPLLTATLGIRYEYYPFGYSDNGKGLRLLDLNTGNVLIGGYGSIPKNDHMDVGNGLWLPRLGIAYRVTSSTVFRAGYGMSADPYTWHVLRNAYPAVLLDTNTAASTANYVPAASLTGLNATGLAGGTYSVPTGITLAPLPDLSTGVVPLLNNPKTTGISTTTFANPWRRGYINSFNAMIQQQLNTWSFEVGYAGARAVRPTVNMNANASPPGTGSKGGILSRRFGQNLTGTINVIQPFKNNYYDSLQTKVTNRFHDGSSVGAAFTWSKAISYADNEDLGSLSFPYPAYWQKNRGPASFDRTANLEAWGVMQLPFGKGEPLLKTGPGAWILGGWLIDPLISYMTGLPFTVGAPGGSLNANGSAQTADLVRPFRRLHGKPALRCSSASCQYFDPSSFAAPLAATYGNTNRNEFRGPSYFSGSLSVLRAFNLTERFKLQVRADALNVTNTPHFNNPNTSCQSGPGKTCTASSNFGAITSTLQPGGFFGPDPGNRVLWLGANVTF